MGVRVESVPESVRLRISGDIETLIAVPYENDGRFMIGLSDGTLLIGSYDEDRRCHFDVARYGAGIVKIKKGAAVIEWRGIEWAAVSAYDANVAKPAVPLPIPLFPDL